MSWFVYLLFCKDKTLYCGYTNDLDKRIELHNSGRGAKYTRSRRPVTLVYSESFYNKSDAMKREWQIKKLDRKKKLDIINVSNMENIKRLQNHTDVTRGDENKTCLHDSCEECNGTGVRKNGLGQCIHMISCPCPRCQPSLF